MMKAVTALFLGLALLAAPVSAPAQDVAPVLVTSSGQALDAFTVKTLLGRAGVANDYDAHAGVDALAGRKAVVIAMGASIKGFGAAGITAETELARGQQMLDAAHADGVKVIGVHVGGADRRGGLSEQFVELVSPQSDALVVVASGNEDGYFTKVSEEKGIPLVVVNKLPEAAAAIAGLLP